jgi:hypothetical protein
VTARRFSLALALGLGLLLPALPAEAQNALTLYGGGAWGGSFQQAGSGTAAADLGASGAGAASIDWALDSARNVQLFASGQRTTLQLPPSSVPAGSPTSVPLSVAYLHLGGSNFFEGTAGQGAYLAGGLGATFMSPSYAGLKSEIRPSMSLALGYERPLAPSLALRLELRGYVTLVNSNGGFFCSGGCVVALKGDALLQGEALLGLSLRF